MNNKYINRLLSFTLIFVMMFSNINIFAEGLKEDYFDQEIYEEFGDDTLDLVDSNDLDITDEDDNSDIIDEDNNLDIADEDNNLDIVYENDNLDMIYENDINYNLDKENYDELDNISLREELSLRMEGGSGTSEDPYQIATKEQLKLLDRGLPAYYILVRDIDMEWEPFHNIAKEFTGYFDGQNYKIKNVHIKRNGYDGKMGIFGEVNNSTIKNICIENVKVMEKYANIGILIYLCKTTLVENCRIIGEMYVETESSSSVGGLIGVVLQDSIIKNCFIDAKGKIQAESIGGITTSVSWDPKETNTSNSIISNCYVKIDEMIGTSNISFIGGISKSVVNGGIIDQCYVITNISQLESVSTSGQSQFTGISTHNEGGSVTNCFYIGNIKSNYIGTGITSLNSTLLSSSNVQNCYSVAFIDAKKKNGIVSYNQSEPINCHFNVEFNDFDDYTGGKFTSAMIKQSTYDDWDFDEIWAIDEGSSYPYLRNLPKPSEVIVDDNGGEEKELESIKFTEPFTYLDINKSKKLTYTIEPFDVINQEVNFISSNPSIVSVDDNGIVKGLKEGIATITVITENNISDNCTVVVNRNEVTPRLSLVIGVGEEAQYEFDVSDNINLKWISEDPTIVSVDNNGLVKGISSGLTYINVSSTDNSINEKISIKVKDSDITTPTVTKKVNDKDSKVIYNGLWTYYQDTVSRFYENDEHYNNKMNDYVEFNFVGSSIKWIGAKSYNLGIADVYIDGVKADTIDLYADSLETQLELFSKTGLADTNHTIKIVVTGTKNSSATDSYVTIDAFEYETTKE